MSTRAQQFATADDGTPLRWMRKKPRKAGRYPGVVGLHGGGWRTGGMGTAINVCGADLVAAGFILVSPEYRLAPPGSIPGQVSKGCFPDQTNDVQLAIDALRNDPACNGDVQLLGGSAGAYHAAWFAAHGIASGVCMSPVTQLDLLVGNDATLATRYAPGQFSEASPNTHVDTNSKPAFVRSYVTDHFLDNQFSSFVDKMKSAGVEIDAARVPGTGHSFEMWPAIKSKAVLWLQAHRAS